MQNRFKELRLERDLSLRDLGERIGLNYSTIACYETGKREPNIETLKKLTSFFEVSLDYICGEDKYIYVLYENANKTLSITKESYDYLKPVIYFNDDNHRCIDINSLVGVGKTNNIMGFIQEMVRIDKMDSLFEKKMVKQKDFDALDEDFYQIELTRGLVERIKDAIR